MKNLKLCDDDDVGDCILRIWLAFSRSVLLSSVL